MLTSQQHSMPWGEETPTPRPKRRRNYERGTPRGRFPRRPLKATIQGKGCNSGPGMCLVFSCVENLSMETTLSGSLHVPETPGKCPELYVPLERTSEHEVEWDDGRQPQLGPGPWPVSWTDDRQLTFAVLTRTFYLVRRWGSNCVRDIKGLTQREVGEVMGLTKQRVDQIEQAGIRSMRRSTAARAAWEEWTEDPKPARFTGLVQIRRRGV